MSLRYNTETTRITTRLGVLNTITKRYKVHTAFRDLGASIKDIYINGICYSYVCVNRRQIKSKKAIFSRMKERANIATNGINVRLKARNSKEHKAKNKPKLQITVFY